MNDTKRVYILAIDRERKTALADVAHAPSDYTVEVKPTKRTDDQNRRFHAMVRDIARAGVQWRGKRRNEKEWKVLLVSAHGIATHEETEVIEGLEGELVNIRESTALMGVRRGASLIEYTRAFGDMHSVKWTEPLEEQS